MLNVVIVIYKISKIRKRQFDEKREIKVPLYINNLTFDVYLLAENVLTLAKYLQKIILKKKALLNVNLEPKIKQKWVKVNRFKKALL